MTLKIDLLENSFNRVKYNLDAYSLITKIMLEGAKNPEAYLGGELTFYEWLDLYGESSPEVRKEIAGVTRFEYRNQEVSN